MPIFCDNTSTINLTKNPVYHSRTKHIDIRHHLIREHVQNGHIIPDFVNSNNQLAYIFTKPLNEEFFFAKIGLSLVLFGVVYLEFEFGIIPCDIS